MAQNDQNTGLQLHIPGMGQFKDLKFLQSEANPADLVVQLPDGTEVVFPNYIPLAQAGAAPEITLDDGTVVPGQEIVSLIDNLNYDLIAPAAGDDAAGLVTPGNASFSADPSGSLGDDIGHGPYAGGVHIADSVEFTQVPGYTDTGSDVVPPEPEPEEPEEPEVLSISVANNIGDTFALMDESSIALSDRPSDSFTVELETRSANSMFADWDGMRVWLQAGETITIEHDGLSPDDYYIALETDIAATNGYDPLYSANYSSFFPPPFKIGTSDDLDWQYVSGDGSISYTATGDGWVYIGTGFESYNTAGTYNTHILVEDDDGVLTGSSGNDILVGGNSDDVITGGAGDDQLAGGSGSDEFVFGDVTSDGHDTIYDFTTGDGDAINLDALFDALSISGSAAREALVTLTEGGGDTTLTINGYSDFSVTLDGTTGLGSVAGLVGSGNLVVDES